MGTLFAMSIRMTLGGRNVSHTKKYIKHIFLWDVLEPEVLLTVLLELYTAHIIGSLKGNTGDVYGAFGASLSPFKTL